MNKKITLNKVALADWPAIAHDLVEGKVKAHIVIPPLVDWDFHYKEGGSELAKKGRYEVQDPTKLSRSLLYPRRNHGELVIQPGWLLNGEDKCFMLYHDEWHFNADGGFEHWLDEDGNYILVDLPAQFLQLEWLKPDKKTFRPRSPSGLLVWNYLSLDPNGNLPGLRAWAKDEYVAKFIEEDEKRYMRWIDDLGIHRKIREKRLSDLLSDYRKHLD